MKLQLVYSTQRNVRSENNNIFNPKEKYFHMRENIHNMIMAHNVIYSIFKQVKSARTDYFPLSLNI